MAYFYEPCDAVFDMDGETPGVLQFRWYHEGRLSSESPTRTKQSKGKWNPPTRLSPEMRRLAELMQKHQGGGGLSPQESKELEALIVMVYPDKPTFDHPENWRIDLPLAPVDSPVLPPSRSGRNPRFRGA